MKIMRLLLMLVLGITFGIVDADDDILSPIQMRRIASEALRAEAIAPAGVEKEAAIVALCDTYVAIRMHPSYDQSETLQGEAVQVRRRLITASRKLTTQLERDNVSKPANLTSRVDTVLKSDVGNPPVVSGATTSGSPANGSTTIGLSTSSGTEAATAVVGGAAPGDFDDPWSLIELIQRTIRPDFWEVNGGPGSMHYFALRKVLVVRATTQVHEDLAALLRSL